jgi:hypothetical protein
VLPGAAERILVMAEKSATGDLDIADRLARAEIETARTGQALAFALTLFAFIAAVVFFAIQDYVAGIAFTSLPVATVIRSFHHRSGNRALAMPRRVRWGSRCRPSDVYAGLSVLGKSSPERCALPVDY